ncbi:MAG: hypothetical protein ACYCX4_17615 [Bacillota bacterium]
MPIPIDACVIASPQVVSVTETALGQADGCVRIEVSYRIQVVLQSLSTLEIFIATIDVIDLPLNVPVVDVNTNPLNPVVLCKGPFFEEVFRKRPGPDHNGAPGTASDSLRRVICYPMFSQSNIQGREASCFPAIYPVFKTPPSIRWSSFLFQLQVE